MEYLKDNEIYFESWDGKKLQYNIRPHNCCFYCFYEPLYTLCNYFFRNLLYINGFNLNLYKKQ